MSNHKTRLQQLEKKALIHAPRIVVAYADQTDPARMAELKAQSETDPNMTLVIVEYVDKLKSDNPAARA